ncbi:hypothetical protein BDP27DRAFT_1365532 [Rhodocollybia butyracea]|uniref:Uncharacterized protein n=1 Tax=Rhodocollybia butyracea TaxID=206335 RepID=A0A9P5PNJ0_9AGAR|nr:hypothetical protein BDP27DRAFT_1365532 [Rhodocollybia butyracea]
MFNQPLITFSILISWSIHGSLAASNEFTYAAFGSDPIGTPTEPGEISTISVVPIGTIVVSASGFVQSMVVGQDTQVNECHYTNSISGECVFEDAILGTLTTTGSVITGALAEATPTQSPSQQKNGVHQVRVLPGPWPFCTSHVEITCPELDFSGTNLRYYHRDSSSHSWKKINPVEASFSISTRLNQGWFIWRFIGRGFLGLNWMSLSLVASTADPGVEKLPNFVLYGSLFSNMSFVAPARRVYGTLAWVSSDFDEKRVIQCNLLSFENRQRDLKYLCLDNSKANVHSPMPDSQARLNGALNSEEREKHRKEWWNSYNASRFASTTSFSV